MSTFDAEAGEGSNKHPPNKLPLLALIFYLCFGALHELIHVAVAAALSSWYCGDQCNFADTFIRALVGAGSGSTISSNLIRAILARYVILPANIIRNDAQASIIVLTASRHAGWIGSTIIAVGLHFICKKKMMNNPHSDVLSALTTAARATASEAIITDLLGIGPHFPSTSSSHACAEEGLHVHLFCGNFGVMLLNSNYASIAPGTTASTPDGC